MISERSGALGRFTIDRHCPDLQSGAVDGLTTAGATLVDQKHVAALKQSPVHLGEPPR
ncbi:unannotated protein [freshwater metagenome]|uniref:Unannotated protein n=1 Tax=freshwater metagenome TaxID=449393 RepID=A0A6J7GKF0_9ZZZZ